MIFDILTSSPRKSSKTSKPPSNNSAKSLRTWVGKESNRKLIEIFEAKIKTKLDEIWSDEENSVSP